MNKTGSILRIFPNLNVLESYLLKITLPCIRVAHMPNIFRVVWHIVGSILKKFAPEWPVFCYVCKYNVDVTFSAASAAVFINIAT